MPDMKISVKDLLFEMPLELVEQRGLPDGSKVTVTPKRRKQLKYFVKSFDWDCVAKTLTLIIAETPSFSAFDWLHTINSVYASLHKSPFSDLEQDVITLDFNDDADRPVAVIRLRGLQLVSHECQGGREDRGPLYHTAVIQYDELTVEHVEDTQQDFNGLADEAWARERLEVPPVTHESFPADGMPRCAEPKF